MANDKDFRVKNGLYVATDASILGNTVIAQKLTANGNVNFTISPNVALGPVGNVVITGGSNGQYLQTNGSGGLAWAAVSAASISNGNSNVNIPAANGNIQVSVAGVSNVITFASNNAYRGSYGITGAQFVANSAPASPQPGDQWYNTFNGILFEYLNDGTTSQWVDIGSIPLPNLATSNAGAVLNNVQTTGTYYPAFISSTANGNYSLTSNTAFSANLANGGFTATTFVGALSGAATSATTAGTVTTAAQPNITSVGTLTSLTVTGNTTVGNLIGPHANGNSNVNMPAANGNINLTAAGNTTLIITGTGVNVSGTLNTGSGVITGNGSGLSAIAGANVTGTVSSATSATTAGTVTTAGQPNITSVGSLTGLTVTGTTILASTSGNVGINTSNPSAALVIGGIQAGNAGLEVVPGSGIVLQSYNRNTSAYASMNLDGSTIGFRPGGTTRFFVDTAGANATGNLSATGTISGTQLISNVATGTAPLVVTSTTQVANLNVATAGTAGSATTAGTVTTAAQPNITSVGTLTGLTLANAAVISVGSNTNVGTFTGNWSLSAGSRLTATYADIAEKYVADATYEPGTVLMFGGEFEVTLANTFDSTKVAGVVTTNPAYSMNSALEAEHVAEIALQGRVPCKVIGPIEKGDLMVSASNGHAAANNDARAGTIIGKALENFVGESGIIEVAVGRF